VCDFSLAAGLFFSGGFMEKFRFTLFLLCLFMISLLALSCGAVSQGQQGQLQSITLSPAMANARDYPGWQVPFVATGVYINPAHKVTPQPAAWGACQQNAPTNEVSVSSRGVAQCASGATGAYSVFAFDMTMCNVITVCGGGCTVVGTAQLTCP
jgi:hypothetical protein